VELPRREDRPKIPDDLMDLGEADLEPRLEESAPWVPDRLVDLGELELEPRAEDSQTTGSGVVLDDSLDDYFDKLDEAFSSIGGGSTPDLMATSRSEAPPARPDRPVLERDLESFDPPSIVDPVAHYLDMPAEPEADPFAGLLEVEPEEASAVPTLDDLLASMPSPAPPPSITFDVPETTMIFEPAPAPVIDLPVPPPFAAVPPPIIVAPPSIEPPDVAPTLSPAVPAAIVLPPPGRVAPAPGPVEPPAPSRVEEPPAAPQAVRAPAPVARAAAPLESGRSIIADAFSALLAAEQGESGVTPVRLGGNGSAPVVTDAMVDDVARRVIEKLALGSSDQMSAIVRQIVSDVSERLVREEIERIRSRQ